MTGTALIVVVLLVGSVPMVALSKRWLDLGFCLVLSLVWLLVNKPFEGFVLIDFAPNRGLTLADTLSVAALVLAAVALLLRRRPWAPSNALLDHVIRATCLFE